jgi:integrase
MKAPKLPKSPTFPLQVKVGSVSVSIYKSESKGLELFMVVYYEGTKRVRESRRSFEDAWARAHEVAQLLSANKPPSLELSGEDQLAYRRALQLLGHFNVAVDVAASEYAAARTRLGSYSLLEAADYYVRTHPNGASQKTVAEVVDELIAARKADNCSAVYLRDLTVRLGKFKKDFNCAISSLTPVAVSDWLRALPVSGRTRNNWRNNLRTLWSFAVSRDYVTEEALNWDKVGVAKEENPKIEFFSLSELEKLIAAAQVEGHRYMHRPGLLPVLVLGAFAGMRSAEIKRQLWSDILLDRGFIRVTAAKGNTAQKRLIPIQPNLVKWLAECKKVGDHVSDYPRPEDAIQRLAERAGIPWKRNGLRHSFISYRIADIQNVAQVALEAGNSPSIIFKHYRALVTPEEAKAWFSLVPEPASDQPAALP